MKDFDEKIAQKFLKDWRGFQKYISLYQKSKSKFIEFGKNLDSKKLKVFNNKQLALFYQDFEEKNQEFMIKGQWIAFEMIEMIPQIVKQKLENENIEPEKIDRILTIILSRFEDTVLFQQQKETLKLAREVKEKKTSKKQLDKTVNHLVEKYGWIPSMVMDAPLWNNQYFKRQIDELARSADLKKSVIELKRLEKEREEKKAKFKRLLLQYPKLKDLFKIANWLTYLKDDRDESRRYAYFLSRPLFYEVAKRAKRNITQILTLSHLEILDFLKNGVLPSQKEISQRRRNFIIFVKDKDFIIYSGKKAEKFSKKYLDKKEKVNNEEMSGTIASPGKVRGIVKIITDKKNLSKVKKDNIMVAVTTHPDYLPTMRLTKAIVTDEGGLTSHAAIVSRELNIPCIVGTKIATKILKDGDKVEVDADRGIVRILK